MQIVLGTAAMGANYGIANKKLLHSSSIAKEILNSAMNSEIKILDTAPQYGNAQKYIGEFHENNQKFKVYSKIPLGSEGDPFRVLECIKNSLSELRISKLAGIYFHSSERILSMKKEEVLRTIDLIYQSELVETVGVSIYDLSELERVQSKFENIKLFQVPENIMDQRLINAPYMTYARNQGNTFIVRSIFLQGLLLMNPADVNFQKNEARGGIELLRKFANTYEVDPIDICLSYIELISWANSVVIGVSRKEHLSRILNYKHVNLSDRPLPVAFTANISDPRNWS